MTRKRSHWDDEQRAEVGRAERERVRTNPHGVVIANAPEVDSDGTPDAELPADAELTEPSDAILADPIAREIWEHVARVAKRSVRRHQDTGNLIAEVHADAGNQHLGARVAKLEKTIRWWQGLAIAALTAAAGSLVTVAKGLYERGEREGAAVIRLEHVEKGVEQNRLDIRDMRDRYFRREPSNGWLRPPSKETP